MFYDRLLDTVLFKMDSKNKAKEIVDKYVNLPINFPYIDTEDGNCIGSGYMTYKSAVKCAKLEVNAILETNPSVKYWDTYDDETPSAITFWNEVKTELDALS